MKEIQPSLLNLDTMKEAECPVCKAISRPMFPMQEYTCGHCDHTWQPATHATMQPLFQPKEKEPMTKRMTLRQKRQARMQKPPTSSYALKHPKGTFIAPKPVTMVYDPDCKHCRRIMISLIECNRQVEVRCRSGHTVKN